MMMIKTETWPMVVGKAISKIGLGAWIAAASASCSEPTGVPAGSVAVGDSNAPAIFDSKVSDSKTDSDASSAELASTDGPTTADSPTDAQTTLDGDEDAGRAADLDPTADAQPDATSQTDDTQETFAQEIGEENDIGGADAAKACSIDSECDDANECTTDTCTSEGCAYQAKNCDDGLQCTADACDKNNGNCKNKALADTCAIDGSCFGAAEASAANACMACNPATSATSWTAQSGSACDDGNACTGKDECNLGTCIGVAKPSCCIVNLDCAVSDICSTATCDVASGACQISAKPDCCSDGACCDLVTHQAKAAGVACGAGVLASQWQCSGQDVQNRSASAGCTGSGPTDCSSAVGNYVWSPWATVKTCAVGAKCVATGTAAATCVVTEPVECVANGDCDDKNACTDDACSAAKCSHLTQKCTATASCQLPYCDSKTGQCATKWQAGTCEIGGACMVSGVKNPANPCLTCQPAITQNQWTPLASCKCAGGTCCDAGVVKPVNSSCGTTKLATEYGCSADGKATTSRVALAGCTGGQAICSSASTFYAWQPWISVACKADELCENTDKLVASTCSVADPLCTQADSYEAGTALAKAHDLGIFVDSTAAKALTPLLLLSTPADVDVLKWNVTDGANTFAPALGVSWSSAQPAKVCLYAACTGGVNAKNCQPLTCPAGTVAATSSSVSAATPNGCCSTGTKGSVALSPKPATGTGLGLVGYLEVTNNSTACTQLAITLTFGTATTAACKAGVDPCCEANGAYSAQAKACGTLTLASEYKCDSNLAGGKVLVRKAVSGCTGTSTTCSAATANYAWGAYTTYKACLASELCSVTATSVAGTCKPATECVADSQCCTSAGKFASSGSACGKSSATEYQCSGANVQIRKQFSTCGGTSSSCFGTAQWSTWTTVAACATSETCTAGATKATLPTCKAAAPDLCKLVDKWESVEATAASLDLGIYSDAATAIYIDPKVLLQTATDKDFFQYAITDDTNLYDPQVYVSWVAAKPVTVCAYYRCSTGANGKNCADISCPFGSDSFVNTAVSGSAVNGCCKTGAGGTLSYYPDAPGLDETGIAFVNIKNGDPSCQQVSIKIAFGASTVTKCDPGNTCCSGKGTYAAGGTECGSPTKIQYRCATASGVNQIQKQTGLGTCSGTSTACSTTTVTWGSWALDQPCLSPEFCAVGLPTGTAACIVGKPGSCAGFCGGKSKDGCQCDSACATFGDCCKDFAAKCSGTCDGSCGGLGKIGGCFCDALCVENGDCCLDKVSKCP